uniref:Uncharacterized protein n=1 Tax=Scleropages formosus TaxID=113540 RepID=A0A8C9R919_SCLFO
MVYEQPHDVDEQPQGAHDEHELGLRDGLGHGQPVDALHAHGEAERAQEDGVGERAHHLGARQPVGAARRAGAPQHATRRDPHAQGQQVREHVEGVGHERHGVAEVADEDLGDEEERRDHENEDETARFAGVAPHVCGGVGAVVSSGPSTTAASGWWMSERRSVETRRTSRL